MPERLTCNLRTCQDAKGVYERFLVPCRMVKHCR